MLQNVFRIQLDVQRDRNVETWHIVRQCEQPLATSCGVFARTNCNHGFSISQPQGDRDSANCLVLPFEFPLVVDYERFVDIEFQLRELAFAGRKIGRGHENRNKTRFSSFSSPRQKNFRLDWTRRFATQSKLCKNKVQSFRRYRRFS